MQLGFVGLGAMGLPMTRHLLEAGHQVTVASRSAGPIEVAVALGARRGGTPAGVAEAADVSRGSSAHDILGVAAIVGVQATDYLKLYPGADKHLPGE